MTWHYVQGADQKGPVSDADLTALAASGVVNYNTLVWREGMADWQPYGQVKAGQAVPAGAAPLTISGGVACVECGRVFPPSDLIRLAGSHVCADCKPVFLQKMREGVAPKGQLNYAGFGVRAGSYIVDAILLIIVTQPINWIAQKTLGLTGTVIGFFFNLAVGVSYYTFFLGKYGATLGKMLNKLKVVNADGSPISYGKACGRYFAATWISGLTLCIGYLMVLWDDEKRALHDRICNTRVVRR